MQKIKKFSARTVNLPNEDIDTDQIIPARFLTRQTTDGIGKCLFADWRFDKSGRPKEDFILNQPESSNAEILVAGNNFGCGSSREHAPACLKIAGIQAIIATSYARIFYRNSVDGGFFIPFESSGKLVNNICTGDNLTINVETETLTNNSSNQTFKLQPLGEVAEIVKAGNIFEYARKAGMI